MKQLLFLLLSPLALFGQTTSAGHFDSDPFANGPGCSGDVTASNVHNGDVQSATDHGSTNNCDEKSESGFGGGRGATQNESNSHLQMKNGSSPSATPINASGAVASKSEDQKLASPNPSYDIRSFGARATDFATYASTTARCTSGSKFVTLAKAIDFVNGDGIAITGCGPATLLSRPSAPTVTPKGLTGGTKYDYKIIAVDTSGGYTVASTTGSTTTGHPLSSSHLNSLHPILLQAIARCTVPRVALLPRR